MKFTDLTEGIYSVSIVIIRKNDGNSERKINFLTEKLIVLTLLLVFISCCSTNQWSSRGCKFMEALIVACFTVLGLLYEMKE